MTSKKGRKVISLDDKLMILQRKRDGEKAVNIALSMGLAATTVRTICNRDFEKIHEVAVNVSSNISKNVTRSRQPIINQMESLLLAWIHDMNERNLPLSQKTITNKAKCLFANLKEAAGNTTDTSSMNFEASRGWFHRFRGRAEITSYGASVIKHIKIEQPVDPIEIHPIIIAEKVSLSSKQKISKALKLIEKAMDIIDKCDHDKARSFQVLRNVKEATKCYRYMFKEQKKTMIQTKINKYFLPTY